MDKTSVEGRAERQSFVHPHMEGNIETSLKSIDIHLARTLLDVLVCYDGCTRSVARLGLPMCECPDCLSYRVKGQRSHGKGG